jgi:beta-galactosidase
VVLADAQAADAGARRRPGFEENLPQWQPNPIHAAVGRTMPGTAALATDYRTHFWGGSTLTRTYAVYDEVGTQRTVTVSWTLRLRGGPTRSGSTQVSVPPDGHTDVTFDIAMPTVKKIAEGTLTVKVYAGGPVLYQDEAPVTVYPASAGQRATTAPLAAAVLETGGSTATSEALAALGVTTTTVTDLSSLPTGQQVLVLGEGATVNPTSDQTSALISFVQGGGRYSASPSRHCRNCCRGRCCWPARRRRSPTSPRRTIRCLPGSARTTCGGRTPHRSKWCR